MAVIYHMTTSAGTRGATSGRPRHWREGQDIEAPEGEFDHLPGGRYEVRPVRPKDNVHADTAFSCDHVGGGWYEVRDASGELVEKVRGKDAALNILNDEG